MAPKKAWGKIRFGAGCCMCLRARIRGCNIDLRLLVRKECVSADTRVNYSANGRDQIQGSVVWFKARWDPTSRTRTVRVVRWMVTSCALNVTCWSPAEVSVSISGYVIQKVKGLFFAGVVFWTQRLSSGDVYSKFNSGLKYQLCENRRYVQATCKLWVSNNFM